MNFPRVKYGHWPSRRRDGSIRIGGGIYGVAAEIRDPHGWIWATLELMDGSRSGAELATQLTEHFPELTPSMAIRLVDGLTASGFVEDAAPAAQHPQELSASELERYRSNRAFFGYSDRMTRNSPWHAQLKLKQSRVVVLGLGGTGSHAAWALTAAGVGRMHLVDHDKVELSNLTRQVLYTEQDVGKPKAQAAAERLRAVNSEVAISYSTRAVDGEAAFTALLAECDGLALCADEPDGETIRLWASSACAKARVPWVGGGYSGPLVTVGVFGPNGPCVQCIAAGEEARLDEEEPPYLRGGGAIAPSAGISGQLAAYELLALLTGISRQEPGYVRGVNLLAPEHHILVRHEARPDCRICHG